MVRVDTVQGHIQIKENIWVLLGCQHSCLSANKEAWQLLIAKLLFHVPKNLNLILEIAHTNTKKFKMLEAN